MQCPLRYPLSDSKQTKMCPDKLCSDDCSSPFRMAPFGVTFDQCKSEPPEQFVVDGAVWDMFTITKILSDEEKKSASKSVIAFGKTANPSIDVVLKMFAVEPNAEAEVSNLLYEVGVYEAMRRLAEAVPHFVTSLAAFDYRWVDLNLPDPHRAYANMARALQASKSAQYHILITNKARGIPLSQYLKTAQPVDVLQSLLFQLLFCIYAMTMAGFQHNDLHHGNVIVDTDPRCTRGVYKFENQTFIVPTPVRISIYDFDFGSCAICGPNPSLDLNAYCFKYGVCNQRNPRFDMYTILRNIETSVAFSAAPAAMAIIDVALGLQPIPEHFQYRMCNELSPKQCIPYPINEPASIKTPAELLLTQFNQYRIRRVLPRTKLIEDVPASGGNLFD